MESIIRCTRCILPSNLKGITFDKHGVCNHCRDYERNFGEWETIKDRKEKELQRILRKAKSLRRTYDVLIPLSGGKDSTYALYLCAKVYKMKVLAVTLDNGFMTQPAKENIKNALESCSADHLNYTMNRNNSLVLFKVFTQKTGDFCNACMREINFVIEHTTRNFNIPLIIRGSGRRVQYISQIKEISGLNTASYFANVVRKTRAEKDFKYLYNHRFRSEFQKTAGGLADVFGFSRLGLMRFIPQHIGMYDYIYLPFNEIIDILKKEMNWSDASKSVEHLDCQLHNIPSFKETLRIPNITKHTFHNSGLIRQGLMQREEAIGLEIGELEKKDPPAELMNLLLDFGLSYEEYKTLVVSSDRSVYEPEFQKLIRAVYHRFRRY